MTRSAQHAQWKEIRAVDILVYKEALGIPDSDITFRRLEDFCAPDLALYSWLGYQRHDHNTETSRQYETYLLHCIDDNTKQQINALLPTYQQLHETLVSLLNADVWNETTYRETRTTAHQLADSIVTAARNALWTAYRNAAERLIARSILTYTIEPDAYGKHHLVLSEPTTPDLQHTLSA